MEGTQMQTKCTNTCSPFCSKFPTSALSIGFSETFTYMFRFLQPQFSAANYFKCLLRGTCKCKQAAEEGENTESSNSRVILRCFRSGLHFVHVLQIRFPLTFRHTVKEVLATCSLGCRLLTNAVVSRSLVLIKEACGKRVLGMQNPK